MEASVLMTETEPHFPSLMQTARLTTAARRDTFLKKRHGSKSSVIGQTEFIITLQSITKENGHSGKS